MTMWRWVVHRFVAAMKEKGAGGGLEGRCEELLVKLSEACTALEAPMLWSFPLLSTLSMLFSVFMWWDTTGEVSWEVPLLAVAVVMFAVLTLHWRGRIVQAANRKSHCQPSVEKSCEITDFTVNALHDLAER